MTPAEPTGAVPVWIWHAPSGRVLASNRDDAEPRLGTDDRPGTAYLGTEDEIAERIRDNLAGERDVDDRTAARLAMRVVAALRTQRRTP